MTVINLRDYPVRSRTDRTRALPPGTALIDRRTRYGNPYGIGLVVRPLSSPDDGSEDFALDRAMAIGAFRQYLLRRLTAEPDWLEPLRGKVLACWCTPEPCHGEVIEAVLACNGDWPAIEAVLKAA